MVFVIVVPNVVAFVAHKLERRIRGSGVVVLCIAISSLGFDSGSEIPYLFNHMLHYEATIGFFAFGAYRYFDFFWHTGS